MRERGVKESKSLQWKINKVNSEVTQWQKKGLWISILFFSFIYLIWKLCRNSSNDVPFSPSLLLTAERIKHLEEKKIIWGSERQKESKKKLCVHTKINSTPFLIPSFMRRRNVYLWRVWIELNLNIMMVKLVHKRGLWRYKNLNRVDH